MNVESTTRSRRLEPAFHPEDLPQSADYRTLSVTAIIALVFGLAAPLCFAWPLLMVIPVVGAVISMIALRQIAASDGALAGRWAAAAALALCVACAAGAVSRNVVIRQIQAQRAEVFARDWIALLLSGETQQAFRLTLEGVRPPRPPDPEMPASVQPKSPYEQFVDNPFTRAVVGLGGGEIQFLGTLVFEQRPYRQCIVRQKFEISPKAVGDDDAPDSQPMEITVTSERSRLAGEIRPRWLVVSFEGPATAHDHASH